MDIFRCTVYTSSFPQDDDHLCSPGKALAGDDAYTQLFSSRSTRLERIWSPLTHVVAVASSDTTTRETDAVAKRSARARQSGRAEFPGNEMIATSLSRHLAFFFFWVSSCPPNALTLRIIFISHVPNCFQWSQDRRNQNVQLISLVKKKPINTTLKSELATREYNA